MFRVGVLTAIAVLAFAANSVLARLALGTVDLDASGYKGIRLISGAIMLGALLYWRRGSGVILIAEPLTQSLQLTSAGVIAGAGLAMLAAEWCKSTATGFCHADPPGA